MTTNTDTTQRALTQLEDEQRQLPEQMTAARRAGDSGEHLRLQQRAEDLPAEIATAKVEVLRARLESTWTEAEQRAAEEETARVARDEAEVALARAREATTPRERTASEVAETAAAAVVAMDASHAAVDAHLAAQQATALALAEIDELEESFAAATGKRPPAGSGLRAAPRPLIANFQEIDPRDKLQADLVGDRARPTLLKAGTRPPRWAAWVLKDNPYAFAGATA